MSYVAAFGTPRELEEKSCPTLATAQGWLLGQVRTFVRKNVKFDFEGCRRLDPQTAAKFAGRPNEGGEDCLTAYLDAAEITEFHPFLFEMRILHDSLTITASIRLEK